MSPASSGPLEIERYIGACLISSHHRNKASVQNPGSGNSIKGCNGRDVYYPREPYVHDMYNSGGYVTLDGRYRPRRCNSVDGWAGGMPLISFANSQRRNRRPDVVDVTRCSSPRVKDDAHHHQHNPLSRLAVHTQGLPLILSGKHGNRRSKAARSTQLPQGRGVVDSAKKIGECKDSTVNGVDSLSVASDESSGSNNSENSLPRIIKPRKRRKKDRKPHPTRSTPDGIPDHHQDGCTGSSSIVTLKPYVPYCYERYTRDCGVYAARNNTSTSSSGSNVDVSERTVMRQNVTQDMCNIEVQQGSNINNNNNKSSSDLTSETPQLHHRFEDVVGGLDGDGDNCEPSSCQCRYCDPAGQIWDVDRHCYSPFLTSPTFRHVRPTYADTSVNASMMSPAKKKQHQFSERISSALQSQCLISAFSLDLEDISVRNCKDAEVCRPLPNRTQQQCLEISTTIVTSPNGHRDLEIRLFSSTSSPIDDDRPPKYNNTRGEHQVVSMNNNKLIDKCDELCIINDDYGRLTPEE